MTLCKLGSRGCYTDGKCRSALYCENQTVSESQKNTVDQSEDKISQLETALSHQRELASKYQKDAAKYRTLYYNLLRRYRELTEDR